MEEYKTLVCSLAHALKLKELGVEQHSLFYYTDTRKSWKQYNCPPTEHYLDDFKFVPFWGIDDKDCEIELNMGIEDAKRSTKGYNESEPVSAPTLEGLYGIIKQKGLGEAFANHVRELSNSGNEMCLTVSDKNIVAGFICDELSKRP